MTPDQNPMNAPAPPPAVPVPAEPPNTAAESLEIWQPGQTTDTSQEVTAAVSQPGRLPDHFKLRGLGWVGGLLILFSAVGFGLYSSQSSNNTSGDDGLKKLSNLISALGSSSDANHQDLHINFNTIIDNGKQLTATGRVLIQNEVNSVSSFAVQNAAGNNLLVADTTNGKVAIGNAPTTDGAALQVTGDISTNGVLTSTALASNTNAFALNNQGLTLGGVLVCTSAGCIAANVLAPIDVTNFAQLSANQTFSGANNFSAQLQAGGGINSLAAYMFNGSTGLTFSCPIGTLLTESVVQGGIITGGSCVATGSGVTAINTFGGTITLQGTANQVLVNNAAGTITLSTPQDINTTSTPTFAGITLSAVPLGVSSGGLGVNTTPANGAIPIGNGSGYSISTLTAGTGITIINGAGSIQVSAPTAGTCPACANTGLSNLSSVAINTSLLPQNPAAIDLGSSSFNFRDLYLSGTAFVNNLKRVNGVNSTTLSVINPTATVTYQLQPAAAGTYDICTTAGNCTGIGGAVTTPGGTTNRLAKFTASQTLGDSLITDDGSLVSISVPLSVASVQTTSGGVTNSLTFATPSAGNKTITIPNATGTVAVSASGPLSLNAAGNLSCASCVTSAVTSLNTFAGAVTLQGTANQILVNNSSGTITLSTPQDINITSAPTFAGLTLTNPLTVANGGLGVNVTPANGQIPIGNGTNYTVATLTAGTGVTITNGVGSIQIAAPTAGTCPTCANTALSNLSGVAINTALLPQNPAAIDLGSNSFTFRDAYLSGTAFVNNFQRVNGGNSTTLTIVNPTATVIYQLQPAAAGTYDICTTAGNCAGVGGSVTTSGGTAGTIAKFTSSNGIDNSIITDNGSTVTIGGALSVNTITPTGAFTLGATAQSVTLQGSTVTLNATNAGITNSLVFATPASSNKTITIPNATGTVAVSASGPISLDGAGNISCPTCLTGGGGGGSGVSSLNLLTGDLVLQGTTDQINVISGGTTITLSTPQNIATTSSPTFAALHLTTGSLDTTSGGTTNNLAFAAPSGANKTITLPNQTGTVCLDSANCSSAALSNNSDLAKLSGTGPQTFTGNNKFSGSLLAQDAANSAAAFQVQNAIGSNALAVDTTALNSFLTNSSFEAGDVSAWVYLGTPGSVARNTTQAYIGGASLKVITTANPSNGVKFVTGNGAGALATSTTYTISWYDKLDNASAALSDIRATYARDGIAQVACTGINTQVVSTSGWTRHTCQIVTDGTGPAAGAFIAIEQTAGAVHTFYIDAVQIEANVGATAYKETGLTLNGVISSPVAFKNQSDSVTAFQIQNAAGSSNLFIADTINSRIGIGKFPTLGALDVNGSIYQSGNQVCDTSNNCVGTGGGSAVGGSGTVGTIAKFTGTQNIGDSILTDNGTTVTIGGALTVNTTLSVNTITPTASLTVGATNQTLTLQGDSGTTLKATSGGFTNSLVFTTPSGGNKTITIPNATGTVAVSASGPLSLSAAGNLSCAACVTSAVTSLNGFANAVNLQGTANQILVNNSSGTITLSTPQDIATTSSPTFAGLTLTNPLTVANGGLGVSTTPANGAIPIGNGTGYTVATLTAGAGITITNGAGSVQIASDCPSCANTSLSNLSGVAINANLNPQTTGVIDLGSSSTTFRDLYLSGTAFVNSLKRINGGNSTTLNVLSPTAVVTYQLTSATAGTYDICTTFGNCSGVAGGVTTPGGTTNRIAKFTGSQTLGNSGISDDGTNITLTEPTQVQATSTTAFQVQNAGSPDNLIVADTTNHKVGIGMAPIAGGALLQVAGNVNSTAGVFQTNGTTRLDNSGNLSNIGTLTLAGAISGGTTITGSGNINTTGGQYQVGGVQISSANLSNDANLAKLNGTGPQTFTGNNKFTGTFLAQNASDSAAAFQIQNNAGTSNLFVADTTHTRIGIGVAVPAYTLDISSAGVDGTGNGDIRVTGTGTIGAGISLNSTDSGRDFTIMTTGSGSGAGSGKLAFYDVTNGAYRFVIDGSARGGFGTNNPSGEFEVSNENATSLQPALVLSNATNTTTLDPVVTFKTGSTPTSRFTAGVDNSDSNKFKIETGSSLGGATPALAIDSTGRVGLGTAAPAYVLDVAGDINTSTLYRAGGVAGSTVTCTSGDILQNQAVVGGIVTGGTCAANGGGTSPTLAFVYSNGTTSADQTLSLATAKGGGVILKDAASTVGNLFTVQDNSGGTNYFNIANTGVAVTGTATVSSNINTTGGAIQTNSTTRLDNSGNLSNIGTLTLAGAISGGTTYSGSGNINTTGGVLQTNSTTRIDNSGNLANIGNIVLSGSISGGTTYSGSGNINTTGGGLQTNSSTRVDNSGNLTNIGNLTTTGASTFTSTGANGFTFKPGTDNTTAFQIQNVGGNNYLLVNTSGATVSLGNTGIASTVQVGNTTGAVAQTINIGNNATASSSTTVVLGSTIDSSTTTIKAGSGNINLNSAGSTIVKPTADSTTAFQVQNSGGTTTLLSADTTNLQLALARSVFTGNLLPTTAATVTAATTIGLTTSPDSGADTGKFSNTIIGNDSMPIIAYFVEPTSASATTLKVAHCTKADCSTSTTTTVDGSIGTYHSGPGVDQTRTGFAIGSDGLPVISYYDQSNSALKIAHCGNLSCSAGNTLTQVDNTEDDGWTSSLAIARDGFPAIAYYNNTGQDLKFVHCTTLTCSSHDSFQTPATTNDAGNWPSLKIGTDGLPIIAWWQSTPNPSFTEVQTVHCTNVSCSTHGTVQTFSGTSTAYGEYISMIIGSDGYPFMAFWDGIGGSGVVKGIHCTSLDCTTADAAITVTSGGGDFDYSWAALGTDGFPVIVSYDVTNQDPKFVHCTNVKCSAIDTIDTPESGQVGSWGSVAIGADGLPVWSYFKADASGTPAANALRVVRCGSTSRCASGSTANIFGGGINIGSSGLGFQNAYVNNIFTTDAINPFTISTNGAQRLKIDGSGNVSFLGVSVLAKPNVDSTTAFQIQNSSATTLLAVDTSGSIITFSGTTSTFVNITLTNAHFKSTQTTAPTIGTPTNCATTPTAAVATGSTDSAGSFRITSGTGGGYTTCDTVITFNKAYGASAKSVIVVAETKDGGTGTAAARQIYVSAVATGPANSFTVKFNSPPAGDSEVDWFYYWVVE